MAGWEEEAVQTGSGLHWTTLCIKLFVLSLPISILFPRITDFGFFLSLCWCIAGEAGLAGELAQVGDDFRFSNWISCCQRRACRAGQMPVDCIWVQSFKLQRFTDFHSLPWCVKAVPQNREIGGKAQSDFQQEMQVKDLKNHNCDDVRVMRVNLRWCGFYYICC